MNKKFAIVLAAATAFAAFGANAQQATGNMMGEAKAGDTIAIHAPDIGVKREITVEKEGKWQLRRLPLAVYTVNVKHADGTAEKPQNVALQVGATARIQ